MEYLTTNQAVGGSNPPERAIFKKMPDDISLGLFYSSLKNVLFMYSFAAFTLLASSGIFHFCKTGLTLFQTGTFLFAA